MLQQLLSQTQTLGSVAVDLPPSHNSILTSAESGWAGDGLLLPALGAKSSRHVIAQWEGTIRSPSATSSPWFLDIFLPDYRIIYFLILGLID